MQRLEHEIEEMFIRVIDMPWGRLTPSKVTAWPQLDVYETEEAYILIADTPGLAREDIDLRVHGRRIVLCGVRGSAAPEGEGQRVMTERARGTFCRVLRFDYLIDDERAEATCKDGIFKARFPKRR